MLFDFRTATDLNGWSEQSDTVRSQGKSKATFDLYKAQGSQSASFFALLNPLPNGACFAGVRTVTRFDLGQYAYVSFPCTATGNATTYKIVLRHDGMNDEPNPTFEQTFKVRICPTVANFSQLTRYCSSGDRVVVRLAKVRKPWSKCRYRGSNRITEDGR